MGLGVGGVGQTHRVGARVGARVGRGRAGEAHLVEGSGVCGVWVRGVGCGVGVRVRG